MLISTAASGFNVFKPTLDEEKSESSESDNDQGGSYYPYQIEIPTINEKDLD
jgi:hypothetical protein